MYRVMSINYEKTTLLLGDIIKIYAPTNRDFNENEYLIEYIDNDKIKILSEYGLDILTLDDRGYINDQSIVRIDILYRNSEIGYVKQNNLNVDTWINIYFSGKLPRIITGLIVDIEEDMIKIKTYPENDYLYIDFGYKGLPEEYEISKIEIRDTPETLENKISEKMDVDDSNLEEGEVYESPTTKEIKKPKGLIEDNIQDDIEDDLEYQDDNIEDLIEEDLKEIEEFNIGENLGKIDQYERVEESKKRFGIDIQVNDLVENIINKIPHNKRNNQRLINNVNVMVERFIKLRHDFSKFDENKNPIKIKKRDTNKSIVDKLINTSNNYSWIVPVTKIRKKIYDVKQDKINSDDLILLNLSDVRNEEDELLENYNSSSSNSKYKTYIRKYDSYTIPYKIPINYEDSYTKTANNKIESIVDNFGDMETTVYSDLFKDKGLNYKKLFLQTYISGLKYPMKDEKINEYNSKILNLTENDSLYITSFIELPLKVGQLNKRFFQSSNIYYKSKNNIGNFSINKLLLTNKILNEDVNNNETNNYDKFVHYKWNKTNENTDNFNKYLNNIVPPNVELYNNIEKNNNIISVSNIINQLIPYGIDYDDINDDEYKEYKKSIKIRQEKYFDDFKQKRRYYNQYNKLNIHKHNKLKKLPHLFLSPNIDQVKMEDIISMYIPSDNKDLSNYELINKMENFDSSKYFELILRKTLLNLKNPDFSSILKEDIDNIKDERTEKDDDCNSIIIAKKYYNKTDLELDNNKKIYFDKKLDDTQYDVIKAYEKEQKTLTNEKFLEFFVKKLQEVNGLSPSRSEEVAKIMIEGKRRVLENNYAILYNYVDDENDGLVEDSVEYYKRVRVTSKSDENEEKWEFDEKTTQEKGKKLELIIDNNCDDNLDCYADSNVDLSCRVSSDTKINKINEKLLKEMEIEYYKKYYKNIDDMDEYERKYEIFFKNKQHYNRKKQEVYNNFHVKIANDFEEKLVEVSPHKNKLDQIFQIENIKERYEMLLLFQVKYTRNAIEDENKYFYYCKDSNTEILPTFYTLLANAFLNKNNYKFVLNQLCNMQSYEEDGVIRDIHTGYPIKDRDFDENEGYDDMGFKVVTNDILVENDENDEIINNSLNDQEVEYILSNIIKNDNEEQEKVTEESDVKDMEFINETIEILERSIKIKIGSLKQFIVEKVITLYEKYGKEKKDNTKTKFTIFLITISMFLLSLQLMYPNINLKRNIPGCNISLLGYPLFNTEDETSMEFMACVVKKYEKSMNYNIKSLKKSDIKDNIKKIMEKIIVPELNEIIKRKRLSIKKINKNVDNVNNDSSYLLFHPPLKDFKLASQMNITSEILNNIDKLDVPIMNTLNIIQSKNMLLSYDVINSINDVVRKQNPLLKNVYEEPFLENACCVDENNENVFLYFENKNNHIRNIHNYIQSNNNAILEIIDNNKSRSLFIDINTRYVYPEISDTFEQSVIDNVLRKITTIETISEISEIYKNNYVSYSLFDNILNKIEIFRAELDVKLYENTKNEFSLTELKTKILNLIDVYDIKIQKNENLKEIKNDIIKIREYISNQLDKNIGNIVKELKLKKSDDHDNKLYLFLTKTTVYDDKKYNIHQYMNYIINTIEELGIIFPQMIINNVSFKDAKVPSHWNLGKLHSLDIRKIIEKYYSYISSYLGNEEIKDLLMIVIKESKNILLFLKKIPFFETKETIFNKKLIIELFYFMYIHTFELYIDELKNVKNKNVKKIIVDLLSSYLETFNNTYNNININKEEIFKKVLRDKEKEKDKLTRRFKKELSEEEKEISLLFKNYKLGEWGVGLGKDYRIYNKNMDEEKRKNNEQEIQSEVDYIGNINEDNDQEIIGY